MCRMSASSGRQRVMRQGQLLISRRSCWFEYAALALALLGATIPVSAQRLQLREAKGVTLPTVRGGFGAVVAADIDATGRVLILGGPSKQQLLLYSPERKQMGPALDLAVHGKLGGPVAVAFDGAGGALVADRQSPRMARVRLNGGDPTIDTVITVGLALVTSMCRGEREVFVSGFTAPVERSAVVQVVGRTGVMRAFGEPLGEPGLFGNVAVNTGPLACVGGSIVMTTSSMTGVIRAYNLRGAEVWRTTLRSFSAITLERPSPRSMRYVYPPDSVWDTVTSAFGVSRQIAAVQITRWHGSPVNGSLLGRRTVYLSLADGRELGVQSDVPIVLSASAGSLIIALDEERTRVAIASFAFKNP